MNWLAILQLVFQLAPQIVTMIGQAEAVFGAGNGAAKKAMVMAPVHAAGAPPEVTEAISTMVDSVVAAQKAIPALPVVNVPGTLTPGQV